MKRVSQQGSLLQKKDVPVTYIMAESYRAINLHIVA